MSRSDQDEYNDFLILDHGGARFLVDRQLFFASVYLENSVAVSPGDLQTPLPEYLNKTMSYNGETLLVFDLDYYLSALFGCRDEGTMKIALVAAVGSFGGEKAAAYRDLARAVDEGASADLLAFKVSSRSEIKRIHLKELRLSPPRTRSRLVREGIIGCRFNEEGSVDFLIDVGSLAFNNLMPRVKGDIEG